LRCALSPWAHSLLCSLLFSYSRSALLLHLLCWSTISCAGDLTTTNLWCRSPVLERYCTVHIGHKHAQGLDVHILMELSMLRWLNRACVQEIAHATWMPVEEYANTDFVKSNAHLRELVQCMQAYKLGTYSGFRSVSCASRRGPQLVTHGLPPHQLGQASNHSNGA
jgi:hypothetical protein